MGASVAREGRSAARCSDGAAGSFPCAPTCSASSLVGAIVIAPVPFLGIHLALASSSTAGMRKESVFPEPVLACARTSSPLRRGGIDLAWISVSVLKPIDPSAAWV